jgi:Transposase IS116/IS110/IS902 family
VVLIDDLERQIDQINRRLETPTPTNPYIPLLMSAPGIGWVLAFTIAAEIGEIERFSSPCLLANRGSLREAPLFVWRPDRPFGLAPESEAHPFRLILPSRRR